MKNKLSHSSANIFQDCPKKWEYHYVKHLRSKTTTGALLFGSAIDAALNALMKNDGKDPIKTFDYIWRFQEINGVKTYLPTATQVVYANSDWDEELLLQEDWDKVDELLLELYQTVGINSKEEITKVYTEKEYAGFDGLPEDRKKLLNLSNWLCLYRKGLIMIEAVKRDVLPNIEEVLGVQEYVSLDNDNGDSVIGYADLVARWKGIKTPVILDFKTSSREYDKDSVLTSPQLTLYVHSLSEKFENTRQAGFIVLNKHIHKNKTKVCSECGKDGTGQRHKTCDAQIDGKRCNGEWTITLDPSVFVQILINEIPEQTENIVLENFDHINMSIKNGIFHRNLSSCIKPWGKCSFYNLCYHNKKDDLIVLEKK